jgi:hypothetical protein
MYCPNCAAQNVVSAKFCRGCGTDLDRVALALSEHTLRPDKARRGSSNGEKSWLEKRAKGRSDAVQGSILLSASLLIGVALALFSGHAEWLIIWTVFFGWMACWGVIALAFGIAAIIESKTVLLEKGPRSSIAANPAANLSAGNRHEAVSVTLTPTEPATPLSVTEHTTEPLLQRRSTSIEAN